MTNIKIKFDTPLARVPEYATDGAACFDLRSAEVAYIPPHGSASVSTGIRFEIPAGKAMMVYSRSGMGFKHGIRLVNSVGVIDSDYRGVVRVGLRNDSDTGYTVHAGDAVAQAMIIDAPQVSFELAESLSDTERGEGGFGSTGK